MQFGNMVDWQLSIALISFEINCAHVDQLDYVCLRMQPFLLYDYKEHSCKDNVWPFFPLDDCWDLVD